MFPNNKYSNWYLNLINSRKLLNRSKKIGYFENHHIIPKSLGGSNKKENKVLLTAKEHFVAHVLLAKMFVDPKKRVLMLYAMNRMAVRNNTTHKEKYVNSRLYQTIKKEWAQERSSYMIQNNPNVNGLSQDHKDKIGKHFKGRVFSEEHKRKLSLALKGRKTTKSPEVIALAAVKASAKLKGRKKPDGFGEKISKIVKGRLLSDTAKEKMKKAWTNERKLAVSERKKFNIANH